MLTKSTFYLLYEGAGDPPCADFGAVYYPEDPVQSQFALWTWTNYRNPVEVIEDMGENRIESIEGGRCNAKELLEAMKTLGPVQALSVPDFDYTYEWGYWDRGSQARMCVWDQGSFYSLDFFNNKDNPSDHIRVPKEEFTRFMRGVARMLVADIYPVGQQRHQKLNHFTAQSAPPNPSDVQNIPCSIEYGKEYANPDTGFSHWLNVRLNPGTRICSLKIVKQKDGKPIDCPEKPPVLTCGIQQFLSGLNCGDKISALENVDWLLEGTGDRVRLQTHVQGGMVDVLVGDSGAATSLALLRGSELAVFLDNAHDMLQYEADCGQG